MATVNLKLNEHWHYLNSQRFHPVGNKRTFKIGTVLYDTKNSEFFLTVPKKKLKPISWVEAGKHIYEQTRDSRFGSVRRVSKKKILFSFKINAEEEVQTCLKRENFPDTINVAHPLPMYRVQTSAPKASISSSQAQLRAKALLFRLVQEHNRFKIQNGYLKVKSINGKIFRISLTSGMVYNRKNAFVCVIIRNQLSYRLPLFDHIISKALTLAYAPQLINTLH